MGFSNVNIYNGGLKDWVKSGHPVESIDPLPSYNTAFIYADELFEELNRNDARGCIDNSGAPRLTLIDFRSSLKSSEKNGGDKYRIKTNCRVITVMLDDFIENTALINSVPREGMVVTISETGNRDVFLIRYLNKFGYTNVNGLQFGMRAWLKAGYPVDKIDKAPLQ